MKGEQPKPLEEQQKNKKSVMKRKRLLAVCPIRSMDLKHIVNISDIWFINEQSLKNTGGSSQNVLRAQFRFKMITKIILNSSFVGLQMKKVDDNYLPPEYFFQRYRSLGDKQIAQIANDLESVHRTFKRLQLTEQQDELIPDYQEAIKALNQFLKSMEGKMYTIYYIEISKKRVNLKNIFFSVTLLQKLGWNVKRVASDFLKYRHIFFEVFSPKYYKDYIQICLNTFFKAQQLQKNKNLTQQEKIQMSTVYFDDQVVREVETDNGVYEEFLRAKVKFTCPHPSFCCSEIVDIDEKSVERIFKKRKVNEDCIQYSPEEQISELKKMGFESQFLELANQTQESQEVPEQ